MIKSDDGHLTFNGTFNVLMDETALIIDNLARAAENEINDEEANYDSCLASIVARLVAIKQHRDEEQTSGSAYNVMFLKKVTAFIKENKTKEGFVLFEEPSPFKPKVDLSKLGQLSIKNLIY
jgi:hypothetical protein